MFVCALATARLDIPFRFKYLQSGIAPPDISEFDACIKNLSVLRLAYIVCIIIISHSANLCRLLLLAPLIIRTKLLPMLLFLHFLFVYIIIFFFMLLPLCQKRDTQLV